MQHAQSDDLDVSEAFELGWQSCVQLERGAVTRRRGFDEVEPELKQIWNLRRALGQKHLPWEEAREAARDAWDQVRDAMMDGSQAKASAH